MGFDLEAFLSGLVEAGVSGLGFGVGLANGAVPRRSSRRRRTGSGVGGPQANAVSHRQVGVAGSGRRGYRALAEATAPSRTDQGRTAAHWPETPSSAAWSGARRGCVGRPLQRGRTVLCTVGFCPRTWTSPPSFAGCAAGRCRRARRSRRRRTRGDHALGLRSGSWVPCRGIVGVAAGRTSPAADPHGRSDLLTLGRAPRSGSPRVSTPQSRLARAILRLMTAGTPRRRVRRRPSYRWIAAEPVGSGAVSRRRCPRSFRTDSSSPTSTARPSSWVCWTRRRREACRAARGGVSERVRTSISDGPTGRRAGAGGVVEIGPGSGYFSELGSGWPGCSARPGGDFAAGLLRPLLEQDRTGLLPNVQAWLRTTAVGRAPRSSASTGTPSGPHRRAGELLGGT